MRTVDLLFVTDPRFEGGVSTAVAVEMRAAARLGLRCGLLMVKGPVIRRTLASHPEIAAAVDEGLVQRVDPEEAVEAAVVLVHHPSILTHAFVPRPKVRAGRLVVVLHHPRRDAAGRLQYDLDAVVANGRMAFGRTVEIAPVSSVVRQGLPARPPAGSVVMPADWLNLIELEAWPRRPPRDPQAGADRVIIGRHARPDPKKWPDTIEDARAAYPTPPGWTVRVLGAGDFLFDLYPERPPDWDLVAFNSEPVADFLAGLDVWVYFHSDAWSEAFGRTTLEAMATGVPVILPPHFRPLFGDAALYCVPADVEATVRALLATPGAWQSRSDAVRAFVEETFGADRFARRVEPILADGRSRLASAQSPEGRWSGSLRSSPSSLPTGSPLTSPPVLPERPVLFLSSNGIGVGHLVQQMAIADRLSPQLRPVFATMSYAASVVRQAGYPTEFLPHHRNGGLPVPLWNDHMAEVVLELLIRLRPRVVLYDATAAFGGILRALEVYRDAFTIWVRRPMWQESHRPFLDAARRFDAVIEPGELAAAFDLGPTTDESDLVMKVPPVLHLSPADRLPRAAARRDLGLPDDATVVALQLGGGNNYPLAALRTVLVEAVLSRPDTILLDIRSPVQVGPEEPGPDHPRHRAVRLFPAFRHSAAFDAAILAAGYNAFHEAILGAIPTLFVPNEAPEMDLQVNRAIWAELSGCGLVCRRDLHTPVARDLVGTLLDPAERARMAEACRSHSDGANGADQIARFVEDAARTVRADRSPAIRI
ncbi:glycosyltransferase family 4 protein [Chthonobacter rhizosphaerae]|uniref:glycosyltransferase family 4 protein n=1 Tax=Chthonobacter rhizosphaerae TaxID=2735553 RepID=UPI0015EE41C2|nr:glycosyltransferase family 4 protein [Chthonobacter rhizosphaerae]